MTTGTNLQLTYDEANDSWSYQNVDYEYPSGSTNSWSGFTSPDPEFEYTPPDQDDQEQDNSTVCPPGYIYDETLKQCLPDPNYRAPAYAGEPTGRTEEDQPDPVFKSFDASTPEGRKDMFEHGRDKGYFTTDTKKGGAYEFQGAPVEPTKSLLSPLFQFGRDRQYNRYINELNRENNKRIAAGQTPILAQAIGFFGLSTTFKNWGSYAVGAASNVHHTDTTGFQKVKKTEPTSTILPTQYTPVENPSKLLNDQLAQKRKQEIHEQKVLQEAQKTEQQQIKTAQKKQEATEKAAKTTQESYEKASGVNKQQSKKSESKPDTTTTTPSGKPKDKSYYESWTSSSPFGL